MTNYTYQHLASTKREEAWGLRRCHLSVKAIDVGGRNDLDFGQVTAEVGLNLRSGSTIKKRRSNLMGTSVGADQTAIGEHSFCSGAIHDKNLRTIPLSRLPPRKKRYHCVTDCLLSRKHKKVCQISGNNGSWTNTDDVDKTSSAKLPATRCEHDNCVACTHWHKKGQLLSVQRRIAERKAKEEEKSAGKKKERETKYVKCRVACSTTRKTLFEKGVVADVEDCSLHYHFDASEHIPCRSCTLKHDRSEARDPEIMEEENYCQEIDAGAPPTPSTRGRSAFDDPSNWTIFGFDVEEKATPDLRSTTRTAEDQVVANQPATVVVNCCVTPQARAEPAVGNGGEEKSGEIVKTCTPTGDTQHMIATLGLTTHDLCERDDDSIADKFAVHLLKIDQQEMQDLASVNRITPITVMNPMHHIEDEDDDFFDGHIENDGGEFALLASDSEDDEPVLQRLPSPEADPREYQLLPDTPDLLCKIVDEMDVVDMKMKEFTSEMNGRLKMNPEPPDPDADGVPRANPRANRYPKHVRLHTIQNERIALSSDLLQKSGFFNSIASWFQSTFGNAILVNLDRLPNLSAHVEREATLGWFDMSYFIPSMCVENRVSGKLWNSTSTVTIFPKIASVLIHNFMQTTRYDSGPGLICAAFLSWLKEAKHIPSEEMDHQDTMYLCNTIMYSLNECLYSRSRISLALPRGGPPN